MKQKSVKQLWKRCIGIGLSLAMTLTMMPAIPAKAEETELLKAGSIQVTAESVTARQPFAAKTAGSRNFRIPAFIVTESGNLLAAADARWETSGDGGGLDTIASLSTDGGATWKYSFPLFFPDSNGYAGTDATTIIDPVLVQGKDGAVYCMADVNPTGVTTMGGYTSPNVGTGYIKVDGKWRLALTADYGNVNTQPTADNVTTYGYYVGDWNSEGYAPVINRADGSESAYAVDKWYNLYHVDGGSYVADLTQAQVNDTDTQIQQNAFYRDSELHVYNTGYIMYAKSTDDGMTWGDPEIINMQIKRANETGLLVSPGKGLLVSDGTIVIPFYEHGIGEENASIIWSEDNGVTWSRSDDLAGSDAGGFWSSESEVVELKDGTLRMFFRSGQGTVCYADAVKNDEGDYEFGAPKRTSVSCTSTCNVSASVYSKEIDGKQAILVSMPGGPGRANGQVYTFLVDEENNNSMTLKNTFSVPQSASAYQYSCMAELPDASIGLLWENGNASIRYDNFNILELVPNGYIPGAKMDVEFYKGETYTREYTAQAVGIQQQPDASVATAEVKRTDAEETTIVPLYPHMTEAEDTLDAFSKEEDPSSDINLTNAEWTITAAEEEGQYSIYSAYINKYLVNDGENLLSDTASGYMELPKQENEGGVKFRIKNAAPTNGNYRHILFYRGKMKFDMMSRYDGTNALLEYDLILLEKKDAVEEGDPIPGYKAVTEVVSGKNYLIAYRFDNGETGKYIIMHPINGNTASMTKLVGEMKTEISSAVTKLTITGIGEGETTAVIDNMTYNIHCLGNRKINLMPGERYFIEGAQEYVSEDNTIASIEEGTESRKALFDCMNESNNNLDGYSKEPNWEINMAGAEFVIDSPKEGLYTIYSPTQDVYLENSNAASYFGGLQITHSLSPSVKDGITSFEIRRVSNDNLNGRYVYFFFEKMGFDAVSAKNGFESRGDFGFEFLEKSDTITNLDPIPGYRLASEIVPGKSYLITEYYKDGIIVLYPRNGIVNQSKLYQVVNAEGIYITALGRGQQTTVTVDGVAYDVVIANDCPHNGDKVVEGGTDATCETPGRTGDTYCAICHEKIESGTVIPALGHDYDWDNAKVTKEVTTTEDGELTAICKNDSSHKGTRPISSYDFVKSELSKALESAKKKAAQTNVYTEATLAVLNKAIAAAKGLAENASQTAYNTALTNLLKADRELVSIKDSEFADANAKLDQKLAEAQKLLPNQSAYTTETYAAFKNAYDNAVAVRNSQNVQSQKDAAAVNDALAKLTAAISGLKAPDQQPPIENKVAAPTIKKVSSSAAKKGVVVTIAVNAVNGADKYAVYRVVNGKTALAGITAAGKTSVTDEKLTSRKASYYAVALDANGKEISDKGSAKAITLEKATKIKKVSATSSKIKVTWNKVKKATGYAVYRSTKKNGSYARIATLKSKTSYTDKKAAKGKTYYYRVVVRTKNGVSLLSEASKKVKRKK